MAMTQTARIKPIAVDPEGQEQRQAQWATARAKPRPIVIKPARVKPKAAKPTIDTSAPRPSVHSIHHIPAPHLYQLCVAAPLPTIDLSNTAVEHCSDDWCLWHNRLMFNHYRRIAMLHRVASTTFLVLLVLPSSIPRHLGCVFVFCAMLTMINAAIFMSIDVFKLLLRSHDYLFISAINLANWSCLAIMLGDFRSIMCLPSWFASQVAVSMDANFRTFPTALRSIAITIPAVLSIAMWCAFEVVHSPKQQVIYLGPRALALANILMYTSTTLSIFMGKKVVLKLTRSHSTFPGYNSIPCVVLRAKMELRVVTPTRKRTVYDLGSRITLDPEAPHMQKILMSKIMLTKVDATDCFMPSWLKRQLNANADTPLPWRVLVPMYSIGLFGFTSVGAQLLRRILTNESAYAPMKTPWLVYACFASTAVFYLWVGMHFQRELFYSLRTNFDYIFSLLQVLSMVACMADMAKWETTQCLRIFSWAIWVHFALNIDALTPLMRRRLRFRKIFVAPIFVTLLAESLWFLLQVFLEADEINELDHEVFTFRVSADHTFRTTTVELLAGRAITILGWLGSRVIHEVVYADEGELIFIRGLVEYMSPYDTFPPAAVQVQPEKAEEGPASGDTNSSSSLHDPPQVDVRT